LEVYVILKLPVYRCKQLSRTVSARISKEMHEELRERCNKAGCTINDWLVAAIEYLFTGSSDFDFGEPDEEVKESETELEEKETPKIQVFSIE